jgi:hypothetical protein
MHVPLLEVRMLDAHFIGSVVITLAILIALHQACRLAQVSVEQLDRALGHRPSAERASIDQRNGWVLVAIALACAGFGLVQGDANALRVTLGAALFPLLTGAALVAVARRARRVD